MVRYHYPTGSAVFDDIDTETLDITGSGTYLGDAGYSDNDRLVFPVDILGSQASTTSASFVNAASQDQNTLFDFSSIPSGATVEVRMVGQTGGTMDADGDFRLGVDAQEGGSDVSTPAETVNSGSTFATFTTGTVEVTLQERVLFVPQLRSDGANTINLFRATTQIEVVL